MAASRAAVGPIPPDVEWYLSACGGGVCGSEWLDGPAEMTATHASYRECCEAGALSRRDLFVFARDGFGNYLGIEPGAGRVLYEDHDFGGVHEAAPSFARFLRRGLLEEA